MYDSDKPAAIPADLPTRAVQDEARNRIGTDGPEFEIKSGAWGGTWNNKRGDLSSLFLNGCD